MKKRKIFKKKWKDRRAIKIQLNMSKGKEKLNYKHKACDDMCNITNNLVDAFIRRKFISKIKCGAKAKIDVPSEFVFYNDVDTSLTFLKRVVYLVSKTTLKHLFINHCEINHISLSASLILDLVLMNASEYVKNTKNRRSLDICGEVKKDTDVGILIHANGVLPHLGFKVEKDPNVHTLDLLFGDPEIGNTMDPASDILKYFSECLKMQGCSLTRRGKGAFGKMLGEVLDNCKLHSGENGKWYALGFFHNKENKGICNIAIVTIGDTIYESLSRKGNATKETLDALEKMTIMHKSLFCSEWNREMLWTWLSLQHGVSRLRDSSVTKDSNRGMGTIDMMEAFQTIGKTTDGYKPIFSIISGNVLVEFDFEKYPIENIVVNGDERRIVTFNKDKSLNKRPDENNVRKIQNYFPGVIYTMEFCIDPNFLENSEQKYVRRTN